LLETDLAAKQPNYQIEVMNFGITGYGPNQYAAVIEHFAPIYRPDLIIIGLFANDYQDVLMSNEEFQQSIGFDLPTQDSPYSIVRLAHLRRFTRVEIVEPIMEWLSGRPRPYGYFLGYFSMLERNRLDLTNEGRQLVTERLAQIKATADRLGAQVTIAMIPVPVQVCGPDQLAYYPRSVDLSDSSRFDLDLPQRMTRQVADSLGLTYYDLRPILQTASEDCPYQAHNSHWTADGHRVVANYLAEQLEADKSVFTWRAVK
jgi:hypothetical protein